MATKSFTKIILLCLNLNYTKSVLTVPKLLNMQRFLEFCEFCTDAQSKIISNLENVERDLSTGSNTKFVLDPWSRGRPESSVEGEGITSVLQRGNVFEKAAVSTTFTSGILSLERAKAISGRKMDPNNQSNNLVGTKYYAAALSLVLHSKSPKVPTFRSDIRYFELDDGTGWFGGGADLTPYLLFESDAKSFHNSLKKTCDKYSKTLYPQMKKNCDNYFYIPSRGEHRGIGGVFFDDLECIDELSNSNTINSKSSELDLVKKFTYDICNTFMPSYLPIVYERHNLPYTEDERHWQLLRRGRYIEFNMLYDRGVKFGLVPGGRIEAVMVSCPPLVAWDYNYIPKEGKESELMKILKTPIDWV